MELDPQQMAEKEVPVYQDAEGVQESNELLDLIADTTEKTEPAQISDDAGNKVKSSKLKVLLQERPDLFSFFQVMRLLRSGHFRPEFGTDPKIRVKPSLSLSFQKGQIEQVVFPDEENGLEYIEVITNLPGLYGTGSPLPTFYTEELIEQDQEDKRTVKDVMDVLNHRLYELLHSGRNKYRLMERGLEDKDDRFVDHLFGLVGLNEAVLRPLFPEPRRLARYLGLFALKNRPASGLQTMLSDVLGNVPVRIIQAVEHTGKIPVDQRSVMGGGLCLGESANIGKEFNSSTGCIRVEIGPIQEQDYYRFFPGTEDYNRMVSLTRLYLSSPVKFDVEIILGAETRMPGVELGGELGGSIGLDSWLGESEDAAASRTMERRIRFSPE